MNQGARTPALFHITSLDISCLIRNTEIITRLVIIPARFYFQDYCQKTFKTIRWILKIGDYNYATFLKSQFNGKYDLWLLNLFAGVQSSKKQQDHLPILNNKPVNPQIL